MIEKGKVLALKFYMDCLSIGIDPTCNIAFPDDTVLNNKELQKCFLAVSDVLDNYLKSNISGNRKQNYKSAFCIPDCDIEKIPLSSEPISISRFVFLLNESINHRYMKKLKATQITYWLMQNEYLAEAELGDYRSFKFVTKKGESIGIISLPKVNSLGDTYTVNYYNMNAQKFVLAHLSEMVSTI